MSNPFGFQFYPGRRLPVVCRDGITRTAVATGYAGHGLPAAVQVTSGGKRRTVSGTVYPLPFSRLLSFYATGRNSDLIGWTAHKPRLAAVALRLIKATAYGRGAPGYIWDYSADHAAALAAGCRHWYATGQWPQGGFAARAVLRRLPADMLPRLAVYFDKLAALYRLHDPIDGVITSNRWPSPPPPPPVE
jgi:hypothetical protein